MKTGKADFADSSLKGHYQCPSVTTVTKIQKAPKQQPVSLAISTIKITLLFIVSPILKMKKNAVLSVMCSPPVSITGDAIGRDAPDVARRLMHVDV
jgi:hypothetical protein